MTQLKDRNPYSFNDFMLVEKLRLRRKYLGLAQRDIDLALDNAEGLCGKWECGMRVPHASSLSRWADALSCSFELVPVDGKSQ